MSKNLQLTLFLMMLVSCNTSGVNGAEMSQKEKLDAEIEIGIIADELEKNLDTYNVEYSFVEIEEIKGFNVSLGDELPPEAVGCYIGIVRNVEKTLISTESISVRVCVDKDSKVISKSIDTIVTAP